MRLSVEKLGKIKSADIQLDGLTLIAGSNESGKSTIGKTLYTIIKAIRERDQIAGKTAKKAIYSLCGNIFFDLRRSIKKEDINERSLLDTHFDRLPFERNLQRLIREHIHGEQETKGQLNFPESTSKLDLAEEFVNEKIKRFCEFKTLGDEDKQRIYNNLKGLLTAVSDLRGGDDRSKTQEALLFVLGNVFKWQVNNATTHDVSKVTLFDMERTLLSYEVENNADTIEIQDRFSIKTIDERLESHLFEDVTFIESPLILQAPNILGVELLDRLGKIEAPPHYWQDLLEKLKIDITKEAIQTSYNEEILKDISEIIHGKLIWNTDIQSFNFVKENSGTNLHVNNVASGTKSFSIVQRLARANLFSAGHLLVFDEPENHLHPEWQIKFAEIIVKLVKNGIPVLLTSHSPYLIEALRKYAIENNIWENKTNFYFSKVIEGENYAEIKNVNDVVFKNSGFENIIFDSFLKADDVLDGD